MQNYLEQWTQLNEAHTAQQAIEVLIAAKFAGGYRIRFGEIEGILPRSETTSQVNIGANVVVVTTRAEQEHGKLVVSQKKAQLAALARLKDGQLVQATVTFVADNYVRATIGENADAAPAFIPARHAHHLRSAKLASVFQVGMVVPATVLSVDTEHVNAVLSVKAGRVAAFLAANNPGDKLFGTVTHLTDFGAFVDVGALEGLVHVSQFRKGELTVGQELEVWFAQYSKKGLQLVLREPRKQRCETAPAPQARTKSGAARGNGEQRKDSRNARPDGKRDRDSAPRRRQFRAQRDHNRSNDRHAPRGGNGYRGGRSSDSQEWRKYLPTDTAIGLSLANVWPS